MSSEPVIRVQDLGKRYQLGLTHAGSLRELANQTFAALTGKSKPTKQASRAESRLLASDHIWALRGISFEVAAGEVLGIIGRNGAGKSTLLKILSRITKPTTGRVEMRGRVASLLEVGTGFHPELTGRENVYMNGAVLGMTLKEIDRQFDSIVDFSGVEAFIDTPVKRYSSGMTVRLGFAVAAHMSPEILIVDEVLAVGDAEFQKRCIGKMKDVSTSGRTVLFVSHNLSSMRKLCSSGLLLDGGMVCHHGGIDDTLSTYLAMGRTEHGQNVLQMSRPDWATPLISSVALTDESGNRVKELPQGSDLTFAMTFEPSLSHPVKRPVMGITIKNSLGEMVGGVNTRMTATTFPSATKGPHEFQCTLSAPPLLQGSYLVDFWLGDGPSDVDVLEEIIEFSIVEMDIYNSGVNPFPHLGNIFFKPRWNFTNT